MNEYIVYKHTTPSGKVYIGITKQTLSKRWKNGLGYKDNPYFYKAIQKYGWDQITHEVLFDSLSKEDAERIEIRLIKEYDSANRDKGYNIALGGNSTAHSEETNQKLQRSLKNYWSDERNQEKMKASMRGKKRSEEAKKNISIAQKKRFSDIHERELVSERQKGKTRTETAKAKTSESLKRFYEDPDNKAAFYKAHEGVNRKAHAKRVKCVETGEVFEAVVDAAAKANIDHRNIIAVCKGKRKHAGGFSWEYVS